MRNTTPKILRNLLNIIEPIAHLLTVGAASMVVAAVAVSFFKLGGDTLKHFWATNWYWAALIIAVPASVSLLAEIFGGVRKPSRKDVLATVILASSAFLAVVLMLTAHQIKPNNFASGLLFAIGSGACALIALLTALAWLAFRNSEPVDTTKR